MTTALFLIVAGVLTRFIPHPPNAVPIAAIALFAGARLPRRVALLVPLIILALSDVVLNLNYGIRLISTSQLVTYAIFTGLAALGSVPRKDAGAVTRVGLTLFGATVFFLVSNFLVWSNPGGHLYAHDAGGLMTCYVAAIPFFGNSLLAELLGTAALFGLDGVIQRVGTRETQASVEPAELA